MNPSRSLLESITATVIRTIVKPYLTGSVQVEKQRKHLDLLKLSPMPLGVSKTMTTLGGVETMKLSPKHAQGHLLYLHGGAYCIGGPNSHKDMVARLAKFTGRTVWLIDYRLAPEHPFPAARDDALAAYQALLDDTGEAPVVAGDSAGGGLTLSLALTLRDQGITLPPSLVLFSPWVDLTCSGGTLTSNQAVDPMLNPDWLTASSKLYAGATAVTDPGVSPLYGDFSGLPKVLIQVGSDEILLDDSLRLEAQMKAAGADVTLHQYQGLWHVFQIHASLLSRSRQAMEQVAAFI